MISIRTSLMRVASAVTEAESEAQLEDYLRDLWRTRRAFLVRQDDPRIPKGIKMMVEGLAKGRGW